MSINWSAFAEIVHGNQSFLLTSHIRPDCDALGSELGMAGVLEALGKQVRIVNGHATPPNLAFIDPEHRIQAIGVDITTDQLRDVEVMMVLDTSAWAQLGPMSEVLQATSARKLVLDHHVGEDDLGALLFKNPEAEATGRLVVEAADTVGVNLTPEIAAPLFAAISTDTGWFRFGSAGATTYELAARLITAGASPPKIYADLYERDSEGRVPPQGAYSVSSPDGTRGSTGTHLRAVGGLRRRGRYAQRHRGCHQHGIAGRGHGSRCDPGWSAERRLQTELPQSVCRGLFETGLTIWWRWSQGGGWSLPGRTV